MRVIFISGCLLGGAIAYLAGSATGIFAFVALGLLLESFFWLSLLRKPKPAPKPR